MLSITFKMRLKYKESDFLLIYNWAAKQPYRPTAMDYIDNFILYDHHLPLSNPQNHPESDIPPHHPDQAFPSPVPFSLSAS